MSLSNNVYDIGNIVVMSASFTDNSQNPIDPSTVEMIVKIPDGTTITYTYGVDISMVKDSVGNYHCEIDAEMVGDYICFWKGFGIGQGSDSRTFTVIDPFQSFSSTTKLW